MVLEEAWGWGRRKGSGHGWCIRRGGRVGGEAGVTVGARGGSQKAAATLGCGGKKEGGDAVVMVGREWGSVPVVGAASRMAKSSASER